MLGCQVSRQGPPAWLRPMTPCRDAPRQGVGNASFSINRVACGAGRGAAQAGGGVAGPPLALALYLSIPWGCGGVKSLGVFSQARRVVACAHSVECVQCALRHSAGRLAAPRPAPQGGAPAEATRPRAADPRRARPKKGAAAPRKPAPRALAGRQEGAGPDDYTTTTTQAGCSRDPQGARQLGRCAAHQPPKLLTPSSATDDAQTSASAPARPAARRTSSR